MITHSNLRNSRWAPVEHFNFFPPHRETVIISGAFFSCSICALGHERAPFSVVAFTLSVISGAFAVVVFAFQVMSAFFLLSFVALALLVLSAHFFFPVCSFLKG